MKKSIFILCMSLGFILMQSCSKGNGENANRTGKNSIPELLTLNSVVGPATEREELLTAYDKAVLDISKDPENLNAYLTLAQIFMIEARLSGNSDYYNNAAMQMLEHVLSKNSDNNDINFQALTGKAGVLLSMHQFQDALSVAEKAYSISKHNAQIIGVLVDAHVELGNYSKAVEYCDAMMQVRPDIRSYSRVSYLRQIHGDNPGAIEAMKLAVEAGLPGAESTEWARIVLGDLLLMTGDLKNAELCYETALGLRVNYPFAQAGLGRLEMAKKNYSKAIDYTENAIEILPDLSFVQQLGEIYLAQGNKEKAEEIFDEIVELLEAGEKEQNKENASVKHNGARELAMAYVETKEFGKALKHAKIDLAFRPENTEANELVAWIYYLQGDYSNAEIHAAKMLSTNTKNPLTLYKAGLIYEKSGQAMKAEQLTADAKAVNAEYKSMLITNIN